MSRLTLFSLRAFAAAPLLAASALAQFTFDDWREVVFTPAQLEDTLISGPAADPDGDGLSVLHEFAFAAEPFVSDSHFLPRHELVSDHFALTFRERHEITGVDVRLQGSDTLTHWVTYNTATEADRVTFTGYDEVTLLDPAPLTAPPGRRFAEVDDRTIVRAFCKGYISPSQ